MHYSGKPAVFEDSTIHGAASGAELFIVEGDSASGAVANVRDATRQAVLPMQGTPLNARSVPMRTPHRQVSASMHWPKGNTCSDITCEANVPCSYGCIIWSIRCSIAG